jgi:hypothetical protein
VKKNVPSIFSEDDLKYWHFLIKSKWKPLPDTGIHSNHVTQGTKLIFMNTFFNIIYQKQISKKKGGV